MFISFTVKEHPVDDGIERHLDKKVHQEDSQEYQDEVVRRVENIGIAVIVQRVEVIERGKQQRGQKDNEQLEACLVDRLRCGGRRIVLHIEEALGLTGKEATNVGVGNNSHHKEHQQNHSDGIVATNSIGNGVAHRTVTTTLQFRMKEGIFRKESLLIVLGQVDT